MIRITVLFLLLTTPLTAIAQTDYAATWSFEERGPRDYRVLELDLNIGKRYITAHGAAVGLGIRLLTGTCRMPEGSDQELVPAKIVCSLTSVDGSGALLEINLDDLSGKFTEVDLSCLGCFSYDLTFVGFD